MRPAVTPAGRYCRVLGALLSLGLVSSETLAQCSARSVTGLYGLATQAVDGNGITATTVSVFEFLPATQAPFADRVRELYGVTTRSAHWNSSGVGTYAVTGDCHLHLAVNNLEGGAYALEGELETRTRTIPVLQTVSNNSSVAVGVMRPIKAKACKPGFFRGAYTVQTQGQVSPERLWQSRTARLTADGYSVDQTWEVVNTAGSVAFSPPAFPPATVEHSCFWTIANGFQGVVTERGRRMLYMATTPGTLRLGEMLRNP